MNHRTEKIVLISVLLVLLLYIMLLCRAPLSEEEHFSTPREEKEWEAWVEKNAKKDQV